MIEHKYEIEKTPNSGYVLFIDGEQSACPFLPPMMMQSNMGGGPKLIRVPCSTICPMAKIIEGPTPGSPEVGLNYVTSCGNSDNWRSITEKESPKPNQSGILKSF